MALISMAVYCTEENKKDETLYKTLLSLYDTVDFDKHRLMLSVNAKTDTTVQTLQHFGDIIDKVIVNGSNIGTAKAINKVWRLAEELEPCIKMDDDVVIHYAGWIDEMEEVLRRDPSIGIVGLKRKDCIENVNHPDPYYRSTLMQLPHKPGERWVIVEEAAHVMGTCQMYSPALLDKIGYLYQPKLYGWDDVLACARSRAAGFKNVFLPHIDIDHIDEGKTPYQGWKERHAWEDIQLINKLMDGYKDGTISYYYEAK